jgi:hypothetical protein
MKPMRKKKSPTAPTAPPLRLDFGCGKNPREGFEGVDSIDFGQKWKLDLRKPWQWADSSVAEAHTSHFIEHLTAQERVHFANELYRVLVPGGKCQVIVPDWSSSRAYGDPTHQWPPMSNFWLNYLHREWRKVNAPHTDIEYNPDGFSCDLASMGGYNLHPETAGWNLERKTYAQQWYREVCMDMIVTLEAKK